MKKNAKKDIMLGDIFACPLPDGRFGAVKVIGAIPEDKSYLIFVTKYIHEKLPTIKSQELNEIVVANRFFYDNEEAVTWVDGKLHKELVFIGNSSITEYEKKLKSSSYSGKWAPHVAYDVYMEWRWENDRQNFENEILEEEKKEKEEWKKFQKPKKMMDDDKFWSIISLLNAENDTEDIEILQTAIEVLAKMSVREIKQFEESLSYKLYLLDTKEHAKNIGEYSYNEKDESYFSPDMFLYMRCYAVAKGKEFYELALKSPKNMPKNNSFEILLSLAAEAYEKRMGKEFDYLTGCDYETFSNIEGWEEV